MITATFTSASSSNWKGRNGDAPEEVQEPKRLDDHPDKRPLEEHEQHAAEETDRPPEFILPREEVECFGGADDEREPRDEQYLSRALLMSTVLYPFKERGGGETYVPESEKAAVEEEDDAHEHEEGAEARQCHSDFCTP